MIEALEDRGDIVRKIPEALPPPYHLLQVDTLPEHIGKFESGFPGIPKIVGSLDYIDGKFTQKRAIEFYGPGGEIVWADNQHQKPLIITEQEIRYARDWNNQYSDAFPIFDETYSYGGEINVLYDADQISKNLSALEEILGLNSPQE